MRNNFKKINSILAVAFLGACAVLGEYKPPAMGPTAQLAIPQFHTEYRLFGGFSGGTLSLSQLDAKGCAHNHQKIPFDKSSERRELVVPASTELVIGLHRYMGNSICGMSGTSTFVAEGKYELRFLVIGQTCILSLHKQNSDGQFTPVPLGKTKPKYPLAPHVDVCKA